mgnify:CR=1 FL=1
MVDDKSIKQSIRVYYYYYHYYLNFNNDNNYERKKNVTKTNTNGGARDRMMIDLIIMYNFSKECVIDEVTTEFFLFLNHRISDAILIFIITKCVKIFFFLKFFLLLLLLFFYISFWIFFYPPTIMNCFFLPSPSLIPNPSPPPREPISFYYFWRRHSFLFLFYHKPSHPTTPTI